MHQVSPVSLLLSFCPFSLVPLPQIRMVKENDSTVNPTFIVKPDGGSQGDGIYLIRDPSDLKLMAGSQTKQAVVQEYIQRPLLIDKLKFDIRLYVLVKSLEPLEIYIAKEGLTRFCTEPYQVAMTTLMMTTHLLKHEFALTRTNSTALIIKVDLIVFV